MEEQPEQSHVGRNGPVKTMTKVSGLINICIVVTLESSHSYPPDQLLPYDSEIEVSL